MSNLIETLEESLLEMDRIRVKELILSNCEDSSIIHSIEELVVPALEHIGQNWEKGSLSLSQVYMSGRICEETVDALLPPHDPNRIKQPPMAIVVLDDYHMLGKRIVYSTLRASGFELLNYNHMDIETLVNQIKNDNIKILLISVLMLPSALHIKELRRRLNEENIIIKILVGGAPFRFDTNLFREVGADNMGINAADALSYVKKYIEELS
jgi:methanogenic corrinoid protein MtbC1